MHLCWSCNNISLFLVYGFPTKAVSSDLSQKTTYFCFSFLPLLFILAGVKRSLEFGPRIVGGLPNQSSTLGHEPPAQSVHFTTCYSRVIVCKVASTILASVVKLAISIIETRVNYMGGQFESCFMQIVLPQLNQLQAAKSPITVTSVFPPIHRFRWIVLVIFSK